MPRSKTQTYDHWDIKDPHGFVAKGSEPRRLVAMYQASKGITQPQAVAELIKAGYASLVSIPLKPNLMDRIPLGATDGSNTLDSKDKG
jgi:hypothetical protein